MTTFAYNIFDSIAVKTDAELVVHQRIYDKVGNQISLITAAGASDEYRVDFTFDARNRIETSTRGGTALTQFEYYADGQIKQVTDARDGVSSFVYGTMGVVLSQTDTENRVTHYLYDGVGNRIGVVDARGGSRNDETFLTRFEYDEANRQNKIITPEGNVTRYEHNGTGSIALIVSPREATFGEEAASTKLTYDAIGNLERLDEPEGRTTVYGYDDHFDYQTLEEVYGDGQLERRTKWDYRPNGQLISMTDAINQETRYEYDQVGNLTRVVDPRGESFRSDFTYDRLNRETTVTVAAGRPEKAVYQTSYNKAGLLESTNRSARFGGDLRL